MLSPLARRVGRAIRADALWGDADAVAVAVSGGADSVALLEILRELSVKARWGLAGVVHVHHGLRGAEADGDADYCRLLASRYGLPLDRVDVDVAAERARHKLSMENAARKLRYQAFAAAAGRLGATVVATGHTMDDQAETVLLRLFRGASRRGVAGIRARRGLYARPLLGCRRDELRTYLKDRNLPWREDASNLDTSIARNRVRHDILPRIDSAFAGATAALARFAAMAADDEAWMAEQAAAAAADLIRPVADGVELVRGPVSDLPAALARRIVRRAIEAAGGTPTLSEVERARHLAAHGRTGNRLTLHRVDVEIVRDLMRIRARV